MVFVAAIFFNNSSKSYLLCWDVNFFLLTLNPFFFIRSWKFHLQYVTIKWASHVNWDVFEIFKNTLCQQLWLGFFIEKIENVSKMDHFKLACQFCLDTLYFPYGRATSKSWILPITVQINAVRNFIETW